MGAGAGGVAGLEAATRARSWAVGDVPAAAEAEAEGTVLGAVEEEPV